MKAPASAPTYDVVAIVNAMELLKFDTSGVIEALGGTSASSLDSLRGAGVAFAKCVAVRDALVGMDQTPAPTEVPRLRPSLCLGALVAWP